MPDPALLTPLGLELLGRMPTVLRDDPDVQGVQHPIALELERFEALLEEVRLDFFPQSSVRLLGAWERLVRITSDPDDLTVGERQQRVLVYLRKITAPSTGLAWESNVSTVIAGADPLIGGVLDVDWSYEEYLPGTGRPVLADVVGPSGFYATHPNRYQLLILLPFAPGTPEYVEAQHKIRDLTSAHLELLWDLFLNASVTAASAFVVSDAFAGSVSLDNYLADERQPALVSTELVANEWTLDGMGSVDSLTNYFAAGASAA